MPRVRSDSTVTHRIELGVWEREQAEALLWVSKASLLTGFVGTGLGIGVAGMATWFTLRKLHGWKDDLGLEDGWRELLVGRSVYEDAEGNEHQNPFAGIPILGSLYGSATLFSLSGSLPPWARA